MQILTGKQAEQDTTVQIHQKRIQENLLRVQGMTQEVSSLQNEITERNQTIREKVLDPFLLWINSLGVFIQLDRISDLELKNQELEKFQYVLNYKIDELTRLINPREVEIERMRNQLLEVEFLLLISLCVNQKELIDMKEFFRLHSIEFLLK